MTKHDIGAHGGVRYLVCELLRGETLRESDGRAPIRGYLRRGGYTGTGYVAGWNVKFTGTAA
jgi:hypothetical protein